MLDPSNFIGALFSDVLAAHSSPVASTGGAFLGSALSAVMTRRARAAREILLDEIRRGTATIIESDIDESAAIFYRYWRAAQEGAGRLNLRLLASVYAGQVRDRNIIADEFLYYADLLASLRRDEIVILGSLLRCSTNPDGTARLDHGSMDEARVELVPGVLDSDEDYNAALAALQRTGLISVQAIGGGMASMPRLVYRVTSLLRKLNGFAAIEGVIRRDDAEQDAPSAQ